jgi:hypothetical protein
LTYYVCFFFAYNYNVKKSTGGLVFLAEREIPRWQTFSGGIEWPATTLIGEAFWDPQSPYSDVCAWKIDDNRVNQVVKTVINTKNISCWHPRLVLKDLKDRAIAWTSCRANK